MIGQTVSHYRITEKLGQGGMGEVYLAEDTRLDRKVALKFLSPSAAADEESQQRLLREAKAASQLNHANILTIHGIEEFQGRRYIVMEYVDGMSLADFASKQPTTDQITNVAIQITDGLQKAHEAGITHRDLKPSNILIDHDGRVRIVDFGIASLKNVAKITRSGTTLGTLAYSSPEQLQQGTCDHRSDIFSFGTLLYELITGQLPFEAQFEAAVVYSIANEEPAAISELKPDISPALQSIVMKCLQKDPQKRYQSVAEVTKDLKTSLTDPEATHSESLHTIQSAQRPVGRIAIWAGIIIVAALVTYMFTDLPRWSDSPTVPTRVRLAVLPFENLGSPDDEYFVNGITEEILTNLAKISGLGVISRSSSSYYKNSPLPIREIAGELGVDYVLEGSVQWSTKDGVDRIRLHPQLIRASDDVHIWGDHYDAVFSDIFEVQSQLATQVAQALNVALLEPEQKWVSTRPTNNLKAYDYFLRANNLAARPNANKDEIIALYLQAIELDSAFALAYAKAAIVYARGASQTDYLRRSDTTVIKIRSDLEYADIDPVAYAAEYAEATAKLQKHFDSNMSAGPPPSRLVVVEYDDWWGKSLAAANKAAQINPDLPEAHIALGHYAFEHDNDALKALSHFDRAETNRPALSDVSAIKAEIYWSAKRWLDAGTRAQEASDLDPRSAQKALRAGQLLIQLRNFEGAERYVERALSVSPAWVEAVAQKAWLQLCWKCDTDAARGTITDAHKNGMEGDRALLHRPWIESLYLDGDNAGARRLLTGADSVFGHPYEDEIYLVDRPVVLHQPILKYRVLSLDIDSSWRLAFADTVWMAVGLNREPAELERYEEYVLSAYAYATTGNSSRAATVVDELLANYDDANSLQTAARINLLAGRHVRTLDNLEDMFALPGYYSSARLACDPIWEPLRDSTRFRQLMAGDHRVTQ